MKSTKLIIAGLLISSIIGCKPKPIDIDVPQAPPRLAISSFSFDDHSVIVSAGYSINSLSSLNDTAQGKGIPALPKGVLVDSGLVTITSDQRTDTLRKINNGLFGSSTLHLEPGILYTLRVQDLRKHTEAMASTYYFPKPCIDTVRPIVVRNVGDTITKLRILLHGVSRSDRYFVSYCTTNTLKEAVPSISYKNISSLYSFVPKQLALFSGDEANSNGKLDKSIVLNVHGSDTVLVHIGKIDDTYFNYLTAYKRSGYLINQLTGEPINLPTNIVTGFGFFSLYQPQRLLFNLKHY